MNLFSRLIQVLLLITTPVVMAVPPELIHEIAIYRTYKKPIHIPDLRTLSYDEVVHLLHEIESGFIGDDPSREEVSKINQFLAFLAMEGVPEREKPEMAIAVAELFQESAMEYAAGGDFLAAITLCKSKSWIKKQAKATRKFIKKHKKAIIIGAIVVVTVTVVAVAAVAISASVAGTAVAAGGGAVVSGKSAISSLKEEVATFKETVAQEQFAAVAGSETISIEENGRIIGSLFAHKTVDTFSDKVAENPSIAKEFTDLGFNLAYPMPLFTPHSSTDFAFSTDYGSTCVWNGSDLNALTYQTRGDWALSSGQYSQATHDFSHAIAIDPSNPVSYLGRGVANFELGQYDRCIADYHSYVAQNSAREISWTDFSIGFTKELSRGIYDSGEGLLLFLFDLTVHPFQTSKQVYESLQMLRGLVKSGEWSAIGEALSPEVNRLITEWDHLSDRERGELSGYAFGKLGADILVPGAVAKLAKSGVTATKEFTAICKNLQNAKKVLVLEAVAEGGAAGVKIEDLVCFAERTLEAGEDLGLTTKEMGALKEAGELERVVGKGRDYFDGKPELQASYDCFHGAKEALKDYIKKPMAESEVRRLIHQQGIPTFLRPKGVPDYFLVRITEKNGGMEYLHPTKKDCSVRVMPGIPHSSNLCQQRPYIKQLRNGRFLDKYGNIVHKDAAEAHIPFEEFKYLGE